MIKKLLKKLSPKFFLNVYYQFYPLLGALYYRFPSKRISVIGVTGTSGKSTTVELISAILNQAGHRVASASSIHFEIMGKKTPNMLKMTMPGRMKLQKFLRQAIVAGCKYAVLEVTSEGIKQFRHKFIDFDVAVFTNLTPEHIESHGSFEKYRQAKQELFKVAKNFHIINIEDKNTRYFLEIPSKEKICFSLNKDSKEYKTIRATNIKSFAQGMEFLVNDVIILLPLPGVFNVYNALAAISVGMSQGIDLETCKQALEKFQGVPGRMEEVISKPFKVIVDYAITPNALEQVYKTIKSKTKNQETKVTCVLGACGGGRDKWKRPELGKIAAEYCDEIILTNEDPYDENEQDIIDEIESGIKDISANQRCNQLKSAVQKILDRRKAIKKALEISKKGDIVIITGKGCEPWMCMAFGKKIPWDDRKTVKQELEKIRQKNKKDFDMVYGENFIKINDYL